MPSNKSSTLSSPWLLPGLSCLLTLVLATICIIQWQREAAISQLWVEASERADSAEAKAAEHERRIETLTSQNLRHTGRIEELNKTLAETRDELDKLRHAAAERDTYAAALEQANEVIERANEQIQQANERIQEQNESVGRMNETMRQLDEERTRLVELLNERTAAYNELIERTRPGN